MPLKYEDIICKYSKEYEIPPELISAMINTESHYNTHASRKKGAKGLMQIIKMTADWGAEEIGIEDYDYTRIEEPEINIQIGAWYISKLIKQYDNKETALAAYNAGSGNVSLWLSNEAYSKDGKVLDTVPFEETKKYVKKVLFYEKFYKYRIKCD